MLANAIAKAYLAESTQSQATRVRRATSDLSSRLKELQERLRNAENTLAVYKAQNNFVGTQDTLISDQQLSASNQRLAAARALTLDAQAKYDQIEASRKASTDAGAIPEALQSPTIANLRSQYADAEKRQAELQSELGPRHPALRQIEQQVEDLRRTIDEEINRFLQSAKNDLTRARDYEASLNKALETQKRQSVQMSQASVRLRELERDVEASRDVYQSFLKRSRETEEQETLNTSSARIIGDATVPQRRTFPPGMSLFAMIGFVLGGLAAAAWIIAVDRLAPGAIRFGPTGFRRRRDPPRKSGHKPQPQRRRQATAGPAAARGRPDRETADRAVAGIRRDAHARRHPDHRRHARRHPAGLADAARGLPADDIPQRHARDANGADKARRKGHRARHGRDRRRRRSGSQHRRAEHRAVGRPRRRQGADDRRRSQGARAVEQGERCSARTNPAVSAGSASAPRPSRDDQDRERNFDPAGRQGSAQGFDAKANDAIRKAIAQARAAGGYDLVVLDGPAMPWSAADHKLFDAVDGLVAILPIKLDINDSMEDIITALGETERKLVGVVINELNPTDRQSSARQTICVSVA